jgi:uncharacterized protein YggE
VKIWRWWGPVIDAGLKAGANQVEGVQFGLRNDLPSREEAIKQAVQERAARPRAMRTRSVSILLKCSKRLKEESPLSPFAEAGLLPHGVAAADASTPVSPGQIQVNAK